METDAADELHIEMHHVPRELVVAHGDLAAHETAGGVFDGRKGLGQDGVKGLALLNPGAEFGGLGLELVVGQRLVLGLELVDLRDDRTAFFDVFPVVPAGEFLEEEAEHLRGGMKTTPGGLANDKIHFVGPAANRWAARCGRESPGLPSLLSATAA